MQAVGQGAPDHPELVLTGGHADHRCLAKVVLGRGVDLSEDARSRLDGDGQSVRLGVPDEVSLDDVRCHVRHYEARLAGDEPRPRPRHEPRLRVGPAAGVEPDHEADCLTLEVRLSVEVGVRWGLRDRRRRRRGRRRGRRDARRQRRRRGRWLRWHGSCGRARGRRRGLVPSSAGRKRQDERQAQRRQDRETSHHSHHLVLPPPRSPRVTGIVHVRRPRRSDDSPRSRKTLSAGWPLCQRLRPLIAYLTRPLSVLCLLYAVEGNPVSSTQSTDDFVSDTQRDRPVSDAPGRQPRRRSATTPWPWRRPWRSSATRGTGWPSTTTPARSRARVPR